jgi:hypothetical protein
MRRRLALAVSREARELALDVLAHGGKAAALTALAMLATSTVVRVILGGGEPRGTV